MEKSGGHQSEIARRFEVPERKAKLATYFEGRQLKGSKMSDDSDQVQLYCICRSSDIDRFMIMCDDCEEWFHGNCINVSEKEAKHIKYFYCKQCRAKNPFLKIKYRKSKRKEEREKTERKKQKEKLKKKKVKHRDGEKNVHKSASAPAFVSEPKGRYEQDDNWRPTQPRKISSHDKKPSFSIKVYSTDEEEKNDSDINFDKMDSKHPTIKLEPKVESEDGDDYINVDAPVKNERKKSSKKCGTCENCLRTEDCDLCDACHDRRTGVAGKIPKCRFRRCLNEKQKKKKKDTTDVKVTTSRKVKKEKHEPVPLVSQTVIPSSIADFDSRTVKQCFGPQCTNAAVPPSKYCSEQCGRRLARNRLLHILPQRVQEWNNTPTVANDMGRLELERIRSQMEQARNELQSLEGKFRQLESIIAAGKSLPIDKKLREDDESETESEHSIYCVVCGHSVSLKSAIKHMDKCYIKIESQMSFGSVYPTRIEGSQRLFCDVFNEQQQTYCKRLQVLCPEHTKEPKVTDEDVCGCPLECDIYGKLKPTKPSHFCRLPKRKCTIHFKWETMYRAEVDLQRIRQWLKIDEIFDEERRIKTAMSNRAGLMSLLLHQTTAHDPHCMDMRTKPTVTKKPAYRLMI